jgi:hypothetical protein
VCYTKYWIDTTGTRRGKRFLQREAQSKSRDISMFKETR